MGGWDDPRKSRSPSGTQTNLPPLHQYGVELLPVGSVTIPPPSSGPSWCPQGVTVSATFDGRGRVGGRWEPDPQPAELYHQNRTGVESSLGFRGGPEGLLPQGRGVPDFDFTVFTVSTVPLPGVSPRCLSTVPLHGTSPRCLSTVPPPVSLPDVFPRCLSTVPLPVLRKSHLRTRPHLRCTVDVSDWSETFPVSLAQTSYRGVGIPAGRGVVGIGRREGRRGKGRECGPHPRPSMVRDDSRAEYQESVLRTTHGKEADGTQGNETQTQVLEPCETFSSSSRSLPSNGRTLRPRVPGYHFGTGFPDSPRGARPDDLTSRNFGGTTMDGRPTETRRQDWRDSESLGINIVLLL